MRGQTNLQSKDPSKAEFLADVRALAKGLMASGVGLGERVAIRSETRHEWAAIDFAIWTAGAVSVPICEKSATLQVAGSSRTPGARR